MSNPQTNIPSASASSTTASGLLAPGASSTLFLGDLSIHCSENDIRALFDRYGLIEAVVLKKGGRERPNLSYGFVKFERREDAERALADLNGVMLLGRTLRSVVCSILNV
jgi:RNA recognition motif-containing protein